MVGHNGLYAYYKIAILFHFQFFLYEFKDNYKAIMVMCTQKRELILPKVFTILFVCDA